jgi:nucleoid-associated protein YgaU
MTGRYDGAAQVAAPQDDGTTRPMTVPRVSVRPASDVVYPVRDGDRLDLLAGAALGDSTRWWALADANPAENALELERTGTPLAVPGA